jgi:hypothetical protein
MESNHAPGFIEPGCIYEANEARQRLRIGAKAWKNLRDTGLPVRYVGRRAFVAGDDLIEALKPKGAVAHA